MTQLFSDERGIFRSDEGEPDLGMRWDAIVLVTLHKVHDGRSTRVVLEFDDAAGEIFVITDAMRGFDAVAAAAGERLQLRDELHEAITHDTPLADPRVIWQRG